MWVCNECAVGDEENYPPDGKIVKGDLWCEACGSRVQVLNKPKVEED
jgi:DNA-directed RNA polymerase subunit RPC12/RpoP